MSAYLQLSGTTVRYDDIAVVSDVSLEFSPGGLIGLIGANGAGKTTLLRACAGLIAADAGQIALSGKSLQAWSRTERAKKLGYLAQDRSVLWPLAAARLVALGRLPHLGPWDTLSAGDAEAVTRAMAAADVGHLAGRSVTELSGGERARVLIARLLAGEPDILLADEPVSELDPAHRIQVLEILRGLARAGRTVVVVLHDLTLAARYCDRLVLMSDGRVVADGAPKAVLTPEILSRYYGVTATIGDYAGELMVVPWALDTGAERRP